MLRAAEKKYKNMPRPKKQRYCECDLKGQVFKPTGTPLCDLEKIYLQRDELEALRLCDLNGFSQEEAGLRMGVSRGTVQRLLASARKKTSKALLSGAALVFTEEEG